jgi:pimeloyl-ACP methyl ester carboxylesterase
MAATPRSSLLGEASAVRELAQLLADPLYYDAGVRRADGRPALVLPGLFGNDWYLWPLRAWLGRAGFRPVRSTLVFNAGCPERLRRRVDKQLLQHRRTVPGPVVLIGHSRGGILARAMAGRLQEEASHLILLGSPVGLLSRTADWSSSAVVQAPGARGVAEAGFRVRKFLDPDCDVPACGCPFPADFRRALSERTRVVSIYSRDDPIVPALTTLMPGAENVEVGGTHAGLVYNREVYRTLARVLT